MADASRSASPPIPPAPVRSSVSPWGDLLFRGLCQFSGLLVVLAVVGILVVLTYQSRSILAHAGDFLSKPELKVSKGEFGALAYVWGTLITSALAMILAVPFGVGAAAYLSEIAHRRVRQVASFLIELLAAIPSVVYGFWGLFFVAPGVQWVFNQVGGPNTGGAGILSASLILAIMIVPYITAISYDVCRAVPQAQREAALAVGATRWQMIRHSVLPYARPGIVAASFLALGRALGETMAVTMLIGNRPDLPKSAADVLRLPFALGDSIASVIANQLNDTVDERHRAALVALGLLLFLVTLVVNCIARFMLMSLQNTRSEGTIARLNQLLSWLASPITWPFRLLQGKVFEPFTIRHPHLVDRVMGYVLSACLWLVLVPLFLILGYIVYRGVGSLTWEFFTQLPAPPIVLEGESRGGIAHAIGGSIMLVSLATLFAVPIGILTAVYLAENRRSHGTVAVRFITELLAGVPSIVIGIFGYAVLVQTTGGFSGWAGAFALGVMMIPVVVRSTEEALRLVPDSMRHGSYALGAKEWQTVLFMTIPAALPAIITGVFLALGRIAGETAPLLLTAYGSNFWPRSPDDRTPFLPKYIYDYSRSGIPSWEEQAWSAALVLLVFVMTLNIGIRLLATRKTMALSKASG